MNGRQWLLIGALVAGSAVGFRALGAHWFEGQAEQRYADETVRARRIDIWNTAAQYQMYHGLGIIAVGFGALQRRSLRWNIAAGFFVLGVLLFSGSLYAIALSGVTEFKSAAPGWYVAIAATPLGGTCLLIGWAAFAAASKTVLSTDKSSGGRGDGLSDNKTIPQ